MQTADAHRTIRLRGVGGVLFDLDGTLVEYGVDYGSGRKAALERIVRELPCLADNKAVLGSTKTYTLLSIIRRALGSGAAELARRIVYEEFEKVEVIAAHRVSVREGVYGVLEALRERGYPLAIVTNNARKPVSIVLSRHRRLGELVDLIITRDDAKDLKPSPAGVVKAAKYLGLEPRMLLMVGDTPTDIVAARRAGALPVGMLGGAAGYEELARAGAVTLLADLRKILRFL